MIREVGTSWHAKIFKFFGKRDYAVAFELNKIATKVGVPHGYLTCNPGRFQESNMMYLMVHAPENTPKWDDFADTVIETFSDVEEFEPRPGRIALAIPMPGYKKGELLKGFPNK